MGQVEFEVMVYGEPVKVGSLKEAEDKQKRVEQSDFYYSYIIRKEYDKKGTLVSEIMVG